METTVQPGDWITLRDHTPAWNAMHVTRIDENGIFGGYGPRESTHHTWLHGDGMPEIPADILQVWRRQETEIHTSFTFNGQQIPVTEYGFEWVQIQ